MDDAEKLKAIREALPAVQKYAYLNTGTYGPMTTYCEAATREWFRAELEQGRITPDRYPLAGRVREETRATLARLVNARPENIALTRHTTEGMNIATFGYNWSPGDEIVTTNIEHGGGLLPVRLAERRYGIAVRIADVGRHGGDAVAAIAEQLTPQTRLVSISHVSYSTGACFDARAIVELCHNRGVPVVIDGAQTVGAIPVDVADLDVDYYAFPGQKWLMGPSGTGGFYIRSDRLSEIDVSLVGTGAVASHEDLDHYVLWPDARRFEGASTFNLGALSGLTASVKWLLDGVGLEWATRRSRTLTRRAMAGLSGLPGVEIITPDAHANLICFRVAGLRPADVVNRLYQDGVVIRGVAETACARFAIGFYNTESEVDRAIELVGQLARTAAGVAGA
ncbi:MAG: aminotransferase class V-fold PLP-dependent enzyme [Chloroflexi bacterium]|nr:aminotransferase class V-fold PLP-dependent enzyme [Chloroflexota bacterium]